MIELFKRNVVPSLYVRVYREQHSNAKNYEGSLIVCEGVSPEPPKRLKEI